MKIFIVVANSFGEFLGTQDVFDSEEKAKQFIEDSKKGKFNKDDKYLEYDIEEWEVK